MRLAQRGRAVGSQARVIAVSVVGPENYLDRPPAEVRVQTVIGDCRLNRLVLTQGSTIAPTCSSEIGSPLWTISSSRRFSFTRRATRSSVALEIIAYIDRINPVLGTVLRSPASEPPDAS